MPITREQVAAEAPELLTTLHAEGAAAELTRVKGCLNAAIPGYDAIAREAALDGKSTPGEAALDGKSTPGEAALAINAAQKADLSAAYEKTQKGGPLPIPAAGDPEAIEAEAAGKKAETEKQKHAEKSPKQWADRITAHITKAATEGRTLSAAQAAAELRQQDKE